jgi:hypothetical protein
MCYLEDEEIDFVLKYPFITSLCFGIEFGLGIGLFYYW